MNRKKPTSASSPRAGRVEEANAKSLIDQGIAEAVQGDHLGALIEKQIGGMLEGLTRGLNETITKTLEQFAKTQTMSPKNAWAFKPFAVARGERDS